MDCKRVNGYRTKPNVMYEMYGFLHEVGSVNLRPYKVAPCFHVS